MSDKPRIVTNSTNESLVDRLKEHASDLSPVSEDAVIKESMRKTSHIVVIDYGSLEMNDQELAGYLREIKLANGMKTILAGYNNHELSGRFFQAGLISDVIREDEMGIGPIVGMRVHGAYQLFLSQRDDLTKLFNRPYAIEKLEEAVEEAKRCFSRVTVTMYDLDHFKNINDTYGHSAGDEALRVMGKTLKRSYVKKHLDTPAKYGGEEFLVVSKNTPLKGGVMCAERVRQTIENAKVPEHPKIKLTVSGGVASFDGYSANFRALDLIEQADEALYEAKNSGRNRIHTKQKV